MKKPPRIPAQDLQFQFVRASGPGGQNVNKLATAAQLRFDLAGTAALSPSVKQRLRTLAGHRVSAEGAVLIQARNHRTQAGNRREALSRLEAMIARASVEPKTRTATRPTAGSKRRRLEGKTRRKRLKQLRSRAGFD
ncbi:MAG TPA: alternative ribosome rescue aminoacyl-tRNA hydrolase ArfB [Steroidobacteraceae bacterium]|jgi:ribosome-associated protein|nr:alternative ribosome rescue aminoacyl-tRNA hydrolase ArfB [Steroidobacteraceae bacterium]